MNEGVGANDIAAWQIRLRVEPGHLAGNLRREPRRIKFRDAPHAANTVRELVPQRIDPDAERRDDTQAGHDHSSHSPSKTDTTQVN